MKEVKILQVDGTHSNEKHFCLNILNNVNVAVYLKELITLYCLRCLALIQICILRSTVLHVYLSKRGHFSHRPAHKTCSRKNVETVETSWLKSWFFFFLLHSHLTSFATIKPGHIFGLLPVTNAWAALWLKCWASMHCLKQLLWSHIRLLFMAYL